MLTIIIPAVVVSFLSAWMEYDDSDEVATAFGAGVVGLMLGGLIGFLVSLLLMIPAGEPRVSQQDIVALKDNSNIHGSFFLGTGSIDEEMYYYYMADNGNGGYTMEKVEADDCTIYEDSPDAPYLTITTRHARLAPWFCLDI